MSKQPNEQAQSQEKILSWMFGVSILLLLLHFYYYHCIPLPESDLTSKLDDTARQILERLGLFQTFHTSKLLVLLLAGIYLLGSRGKKVPGLTPKAGLLITGGGLFLYFCSGFLRFADAPVSTFLYMILTSAGFLIVLYGGSQLSKILPGRRRPDIFNRRAESFPQEERLVQNDYSLHLQAQYQLNGQVRPNWINILNPFRGTLILGSPGSGKTWFLIKPIIKQQIQKGFSMLIYDFKYPDLTRIAYNYFQQYEARYPGQPAFYHINFEDLSRSHRCNPLAPYSLPELADAIESARSILLGLNTDWLSKNGDFWVESSITFVAGIIWYLRCYRDGQYCTWAHVIELATSPYKKLFSILQTEPEIQTLIRPFVDAVLEHNHEQLGGQVGTANIGMGRLSSPSMYYVLTGDDFTLDLNNPEFPKVLTLASSPQKTRTYGAFLSVYINSSNRLAAKEGQHPFGQVIDEASTITATSLDQSIGQGRGYKIAVTLAAQDASQLKLAYGNKYADVILNLCGNIISGQVSGDTAKWLSDQFGKTMQDRESMTITDSDTNITQSRQLEQAIPPSRISSLTSGEFVGLVADNPDQPLDLKMFCCKIINDPEKLAREEAEYDELPIVREVTPEMVKNNYNQVKEEVNWIINTELHRMKNTPGLSDLIIE